MQSLAEAKARCRPVGAQFNHGPVPGGSVPINGNRDSTPGQLLAGPLGLPRHRPRRAAAGQHPAGAGVMRRKYSAEFI